MMNGMKNFSPYLITLSVIIFLTSAFSAQAASINLSSQVKNVSAGKIFKINVVIDPLGERMFTVKAALSYPADLLRINSFTFGDAWMPLSQPGYNEIDNEKGIMIKTGGYPSGTLSPVTLGVITFTGLKQGKATVSVDDDSAILNSDNKNTLTVKGTATLTLSPASTSSDKKTISSSASEKPTTKTANGTLVPDRFSGADIPNNVPSPDKTWLYTKLAILSLLALMLQHRLILYLLILILAYVIFRVIRRILKRKN